MRASRIRSARILKIEYLLYFLKQKTFVYYEKFFVQLLGTNKNELLSIRPAGRHERLHDMDNSFEEIHHHETTRSTQDAFFQCELSTTCIQVLLEFFQVDMVII